jgi:hypothetical protein
VGKVARSLVAVTAVPKSMSRESATTTLGLSVKRTPEYIHCAMSIAMPVDLGRAPPLMVSGPQRGHTDGEG